MAGGARLRPGARGADSARLVEAARQITGVLLVKWMRRAQRLAGLKVTGGLHVLRHTFCSRLAMAGAPALAIKELAGHTSLTTTMRYMHLSPSAKSAAIQLLNAEARGDVGETKGSPGGA